MRQATAGCDSEGAKTMGALVGLLVHRDPILCQA